ncbi:MAG: helix-turn-helix transcriptional regulator [Selenomonadales bacterium]|nr:helix-turn-helix transcriptional regulator [Selenomonadales bacterium]
MSISHRIRHIRKALDMTQEEFGHQLGTKRESITAVEIGRVSPSGLMITAICAKFNIREEWLRHGTGEMFLPPTHEKELAKFLKSLIERHDRDFVLQFLTVLTKLTPEDWHTLEKISVLLQAEQKGSSI